MVTIVEYSFGKLNVSGNEFTSDLIIYPDGYIDDRWWRDQGHHLIPKDISDVIKRLPDMLVIGTGDQGLLTVSDAVAELCREKGIDLHACRSSEAVAVFNKASESGVSVAACFHLTC